MTTLRTFGAKLMGLFRRGRQERDMAEEMAAHLALEAEQNVRRGLSPAEARYAARRSFGGVDQLQERERDARGFRWVHEAWQDLRHAARLMRKQPGFSVVAVLTLALGLSANITVFSLISFFFFKPLPVAEPERLVVLARQIEKFEMAAPISWRDFQDLRNQVQEFSDAVAVMFRAVHVAQPGRSPDRTYVELVSPNYFSMVGVQPLHGRLFLPGEGEAPGADPVVVLSHDYWQSRLGGDPRIVGETVMINAQPFRVIGITPARFSSVQWALLPSAFVPATMAATVFPWEQGMLESRDWGTFKVYGQLAPGATVAQARAAVEVVQARLVQEHADPAQEAKVRMLVRPELLSRPDPSVAGIMPFAAAVFMGLVLLVLLIACANVANLLFARALARQREMGIRSALGASRGRLTRQLLAESVLLALCAAGVGFVVSIVAGGALQRFAPAGEVPMKPDTSWDWNSVGFTVLAALVAGVLMAIIPARRATEVDVQSVLKGAPARAGRTHHWWRNGLVLSQVGFCVIVLVCGGLFLRSLRQMASLELGFRAEGVVMASVDPGLNGYTPERARALVEELIERVSARPGVATATVASAVPFSSTSLKLRSVRRAEDVALSGAEGAAGEALAAFNQVEAGYVDALRVPLRRGRGFARSDAVGTPPVALVNESLARRFWPDAEPLGQRIMVNGDGVAREVVGVVADGKYIMLNEQSRAAVWLPLAQSYEGPLTLYVRAAPGVEAATLMPAIRRELEAVDPHLPLFDVRTMEEHLRTSVFGYMPLRFAATLAGVQGGLGLFLAVMGIYGVVAYSVAQRTREIGVRVALGATPGEIIRLVMRGGVRLTVLGAALGLLVALGLSHVLAGLLYGLNPRDAWVFGGTLLLVGLVAAIASYVPARRALRVDPIRALRAD